MAAEKDYEDLLRLFNRNGVRYCVIGAHAVAFYAKPRFTKDMDILVEPSRENSDRVVRSLVEFGFGSVGITSKDLRRKGIVVQLGYEPLRIDLVTSIDGCDFEEVWKNKASGRYGRQKVHFIGLKELIKNKKATGRAQDKVDILGLKKRNFRRHT